MMQAEQTIPILRIFDYQKAIEFYIHWLGFTIEWEHHFEPNSPAYLQITRGQTTLHLSEHFGDGSPGSQVFIWCTGLKEFHQELLHKNYPYGKPGLESTFYDAWRVMITDPFFNRLSFNEKQPQSNV